MLRVVIRREEGKPTSYEVVNAAGDYVAGPFATLAQAEEFCRVRNNQNQPELDGDYDYGSPSP